MSKDNIIHEPENRRFIIPLGGETPAELNYAIHEDQSGDSSRTLVDFTRTYVPPEHRNKGLAEQLVRRGIAWARDQGWPMEASCSYAAKFLAGRNQ